MKSSTSKMFRSGQLRVYALITLAVLSACSRTKGTSGEQDDEPAGLKRVFDGGPVSLVMRLDRTEMELSDQLQLEQELRVEAGFEADFPEYLPEDFEGFAVVDIELPQRDKKKSETTNTDEGSASLPEETSAARRKYKTLSKRFVLEPDRSGKLAIAPMEVYFNKEGETKESSFWTEEVTVNVNKLEDVGGLTVRPPTDILETTPEPKVSWLHVAVGVSAGVGLAGLLFWFLFIRKRPVKPPPAVPPHEIAWESLRRLVALDLVNKGEIERFYVYLSSILREYIGGRFHVRAPELTTQEFFAAAPQTFELSPHRDRLKQFLDLCDQVKFARFQPQSETIQDSFDVLKKFVDETTPRE